MNATATTRYLVTAPASTGPWSHAATVAEAIADAKTAKQVAGLRCVVVDTETDRVVWPAPYID